MVVYLDIRVFLIVLLFSMQVLFHHCLCSLLQAPLLRKILQVVVAVFLQQGNRLWCYTIFWDVKEHALPHYELYVLCVSLLLNMCKMPDFHWVGFGQLSALGMMGVQQSNKPPLSQHAGLTTGSIAPAHVYSHDKESTASFNFKVLCFRTSFKSSPGPHLVLKSSKDKLRGTTAHDITLCFDNFAS